MNIRENFVVDDKEWRRLCELVTTEPDPERLSELVDELRKELDFRGKALRESEKASSSSAADT
jgi:hypothetical protein